MRFGKWSLCISEHSVPTVNRQITTISTSTYWHSPPRSAIVPKRFGTSLKTSTLTTRSAKRTWTSRCLGNSKDMFTMGLPPVSYVISSWIALGWWQHIVAIWSRGSRLILICTARIGGISITWMLESSTSSNLTHRTTSRGYR